MSENSAIRKSGFVDPVKDLGLTDHVIFTNKGLECLAKAFNTKGQKPKEIVIDPKLAHLYK